MTTRCDIFCTIIDNYGDIGVCWRLARQLAREHGLDVTLWVDDLATFARLAPALDTTLPAQRLDAITVRHWTGEIAAPAPGDIVIEGFGCRLPAGFLAAMRAQARAPLWLNLEYLSAEAWVEDCHGLASVHPATGLTQHFWFPGFTARTGGLLREAGLIAERDSLQRDAALQADFWHRIGVPEAPDFPERVSLFAYENPAITGLVAALAAGPRRLLLVPEGRALGNVEALAGRPLRAGDRAGIGALTVAVLPLLATDDYDRLLFGCTLNAVRGEDSFVRAHWAGAPLLWHIYPQDEDAHWLKLEAFIGQVERTVAMPALWADAMRAWNRGETRTAFWEGMLAELPALAGPARAWSDRQADLPDLALKLMHFWRGRVE
jgi:uncharacterized repeat protein (TIGR03837 family)